MRDDNPYEIYADEYEAWFVENNLLFESELDAIRSLLPDFTKGIEIGVGSGLFAKELGIREGVEPSHALSIKAEAKGIYVYHAYVENLPFQDGSYDFSLMVTVDCFLSDVQKAFKELFRILRKNGSLLIAFLDYASPLGAIYDAKKHGNPFYSSAHFHTSEQIIEMLTKAGFQIGKTRQTIFNLDNKKKEVREGTGEGVFAVVIAAKP